MTDAEKVVAATPLLATKLHAPQRRRNVVRRPRLNSRLIAARQPALTLVSAPAGFGKTTLLSEWFGEPDGEDRSTAWLALDARDNDPALFWSYVVAALQTVAPAVGTAALSLLQSSQPLESIVATLLNDLTDLTTDVVLVLDDYHVIESADLQQSMRFLLEHLPPQVHLVLASRADPPLPLARFRVRGQLLEIRAADLRFTTDEAASYFNEAMGLELAASDVSVLEARTEGWAAALQLAALSMQGRDDIARFIENFTGNDRFVVDYLVEEVLERQTEDVRSFLLQTAILSRLTGSLCDEVTARTDGKATLEILDRANLFLVPLDDSRRWYRYHHLFADMLRARLLAEQPDQIPELHRRAGNWYEKHGERSEAIAHTTAGGDFDRAAELIELAVPTMRQTRQETTLRRWLEALPDGVFPTRPVLSIALVGALMATGDFARVEPLLRSVEGWLDAPVTAAHQISTPQPIVADEREFARLPAQVAVYRAALALIAGDMAETMSHAAHALTLMTSTDHLGHGSAAALLGLAHWSSGDLEAAAGHYTEAVVSFAKAKYIPDILGCSLALGDIRIGQGRLRAAAATFEAGLLHASGLQAVRGTADMHIGLSEIRLERNQLDEAIAHLHTSSELGPHAGLPQHAYRSRLMQARISQAQGNLNGALELLDEAERVYNTDFSPSVRPIAPFRARMQLAQGNAADAHSWASERGLTVGEELSYVREFEHITLARILLANRDSDQTVQDAISLLARLLTAAEQGRRAASVIEILVVLSAVHHDRGDLPTATAAFEQALVLAEPEGYVRVFIEAGPAMATLLRTVPLDAPIRDHAHTVLAAFGVGRPAPLSSIRLVNDLSSRELQVLRLLRSDLSGPDIASELIVSLNTVRMHTKNIYTKLGVTNRREAVRRAAELGL